MLRQMRAHFSHVGTTLRALNGTLCDVKSGWNHSQLNECRAKRVIRVVILVISAACTLFVLTTYLLPHGA